MGGEPARSARSCPRRCAGVSGPRRMSADAAARCARRLPRRSRRRRALGARRTVTIDLADQRAQQFLAVAVGGRRRRVHSRGRSRASAGQRAALVVGQRRRARRARARRACALLALDARRAPLRARVPGCARRAGSRARRRRTGAARGRPRTRRARRARRWPASRCLVLVARARRSRRPTRATPAGVTASRNAAATALSSRTPPSVWQRWSVPCRCGRARTHSAGRGRRVPE